MDPPRPTVDLEKELTCSICTELLYQPLTLLDCLHTFCGACLKEWFSWQAGAAESAPTPPAPGSPVFTCPSCRAAVRDTRHNATVATLLDMFLAANPDKAKPVAEKEEMDRKYRRGDKVLPKLSISERSAEQRRRDEEDRRLLDEVRAMSLREAVAATAESSRTASGAAAARTRRRREDGSRSRDERDGRRSRHSREPSREPDRDSARGDTRAGSRRQAAPVEEARWRVVLQPENVSAEDRRRRRHEHARRHSPESSSDVRDRQVGHQSSLRSLISADGVDSRDIEREVEEFARQIQEEGLLDGLDLDNIDLNNNDELSRKITEAYRRRHRERMRHEAGRHSAASSHSRRRSDGVSPSRPSDSAPATISRPRTHSRARSSSGQMDERERGRYPPSSSATHLEVHEPNRQRRRTTSGGRSATEPVVSLPSSTAQPDGRGAHRSQTDLALRSPLRNEQSPTTRPSIGAEARSSSTPVTAAAIVAPPAAQPSVLSFGARATVGLTGSIPGGQNAQTATPPPLSGEAGERAGRAPRPADLVSIPVASNFIVAGKSSPSSLSPSVSSPRSRSQYYPEPSINCKLCGKEHIEYELHYNCKICHQGNWNICLDCYRHGKNCCLHWFGTGSLAFTSWEKARKATRDSSIPEPHMLTSNRYLPPRVIPGGAEGRRTLTTEDPLERLQSGTFCQRCFAWTNDCYWRCDSCNWGDWGFCNDCVNQGLCCTHPLLPLTYVSSSSQPPSPLRDMTPPASPGSARPPASAAVLTGTHVTTMGRFRPLTFSPPCEVCKKAILPTQYRYHCYACTSAVRGPNARLGDYDICDPCYERLVAEGAVSAENGPAGWRRCPTAMGHRMAVLVFLDSRDGQRRSIVREKVGGWRLVVEPVGRTSEVESEIGPVGAEAESQQPSSAAGPGSSLQLCQWSEGGQRHARLMTRDVAATAPAAEDAVSTLWDQGTAVWSPPPGLTDAFFPPDGGAGARGTAGWAWWRSAPEAVDEIVFPRGAMVTEIEDENGDWFIGAYMGDVGLFPAPYVSLLPHENGENLAV